MRIFAPYQEEKPTRKKRGKKKSRLRTRDTNIARTKRHKHTRTLLLSCKTEQNVFARTNGTDLFIVLTFARTTKRTVSLTRGVRFSYLSFSFFFPLLVPNFIGERERERDDAALSSFAFRDEPKTFRKIFAPNAIGRVRPRGFVFFFAIKERAR